MAAAACGKEQVGRGGGGAKGRGEMWGDEARFKTVHEACHWIEQAAPPQALLLLQAAAAD